MNQPKINPQQGKRIEDIVCDDCKDKIIEATSKLSKLDMLLPLRVAKKFRKLLCPDCLDKCIKRLK